jgi:hypothetical protein
MHIQPPLDQRIVDEYFHLVGNKKTKDIAWLYGMIATYGLRLEELNGFSWHSESDIKIHTKKRAIRPIHPQWLILFNLKEKQPRDLRSRWFPLCSSFYELIACQAVSLNITDLILAHTLRKKHCKQIKQAASKAPVFVGVS